jgi:hypothetical protein
MSQPIFNSPVRPPVQDNNNQQYYGNTGYQENDYRHAQYNNNGNDQGVSRAFVGSPWSLFGSGYNDEPPLSEELGLNFDHIVTKSLSVLNVFRVPDKHIMDDADIAGPIFFCLLLGGVLLLSGKAHFGYIYGVGTVGCISVYTILNLMSDTGIDGYRSTSVMGYCLLPMVLLAVTTLLLNLSGVALNGWVGMILSVVSIFWCSYSSSLMFVTILGMKEQRILIAYPICLFYTSFALMTIFENHADVKVNA